MKPFWITISSLIIVVGCDRKAPVPLMSPDNSMALFTFVEHSRADPRVYLCVVFEIRDRAGKLLHQENTRASSLSRWQMSWISADKVRLESSDIGTYIWTRQSDGTWKKE